MNLFNLFTAAFLVGVSTPGTISNKNENGYVSHTLYSEEKPDYIDLNFFDNVEVTFSSYSAILNSFTINASIGRGKLLSNNVLDNDFVYMYLPLYGSSQFIDVTVNVSNIDTLFENYVSINAKRSKEEVDGFNFSRATDFIEIIDTEGFIDYSIYVNTWLDFMRSNEHNSVYYIQIIIPYGSNTTPPENYQNILKNIKFFNQKHYSDLLVGEESYNTGYNAGYNNGYLSGNETGYEIGYRDGYNEGVASDFDSFSWLTSIFSGMSAFLNIQILPGITLGGIAILALTLTLLPFLIGLLKGGK